MRMFNELAINEAFTIAHNGPDIFIRLRKPVAVHHGVYNAFSISDGEFYDLPPRLEVIPVDLRDDPLRDKLSRQTLRLDAIAV